LSKAIPIHPTPKYEETNPSQSIGPSATPAEKKNINPLKPYLSRHKSHLDFTPYVSLGRDFIIKLADATSKLMDTYAKSTDGYYPGQWKSVRKYLEWLTINLFTLFPDIASKLVQNEKLTEKEWQSVVSAFRTALMAPSHSNTVTTGTDPTKSAMIYYIRPFLKHCAMRGLLPNVTLISIPKADSKSRPKKGFAEITRDQSLPKEVGELVEEILKKDTGGTPIENAQKEDFIRTLFTEGNLSGSTKDILQSIQNLNNKRLMDLRSAMEDELLKHYADFQKGKELLYKCDLSYEEDILPALEQYVSNTGGYNRHHKSDLSLLFTNATSSEMALSRYLQLVEGRWDGIVPNTVYKEDRWELMHFCRNHILGKLNFSTKLVTSLLAPAEEALVAAYTIILIDTGKNASDIAKLDSDCLDDTEDPDLKELFSRKGRSANKV